MMSEMQSKFQSYLFSKYNEWLSTQPIIDGNKRNFAKYLNISDSMLSGFFHGKRLPARRTLYSMAYILGPEVYDALDIEPPEPGIEEIARKWRGLSEDTQLKIIELVRADQGK